MSPRIGLDLHTILQADTEIADTYGLDEVTLASLAKKLRIRPPSLYNHVDGLHGLRKNLAIYGMEQLHATRGLRSILHGFALLEQSGGFGLPLDLDVSLRLLIDTFIAGIHTMKQNANPNSRSE
ncbi:TetR-like C-terminal domain-containing protein [Effusibacillus lacus]|uniref:TetR family transcriptional regulator n=1 Tax=Effusibacillus lacus TaxID=1348429 RepID=A0A292YRZ4_9BACL|nr:TetR-like C-terminal domain-containing protein [Effusibacillus lacus]TCS75912.1 hypothetical protein EDD64_10594 [Effusibacillus lacus]GAX91699.1 TetR family transcriptional regulator [Effusibacillus lacus]